MTGLVEKLQHEALDSSIPVSTLLRKVKLTAMKLQLSETLDWAESELIGYKDEVPDYRIISGILKSRNAYSDWKKITGDPNTIAIFSRRALNRPIIGLEELLSNPDHTHILMTVSQDTENRINEQNDGLYEEAALHVSKSEIVSVLDRVRNLILDWAMELERAGIKGEGINFTKEEEKNAISHSITINSMYANLHTGDFNGGQQKNYIESLDASINATGTSELFDRIKDAIISQLGEEARKEELLASVEEMSSTKDAPGFLPAYQKFIQLAGDHMNILGPFIGPLSALLTS
jgi:hypothetical protein